ncbi:MAG: ABC transporter substrate-binding protein [Bauldia sp.]
MRGAAIPGKIHCGRRFGRTATLFLALALLAAPVLAQPTTLNAEAVPERVVSTSLCADQLLIALAAPDQIAALSAEATNPETSYYAARAAAFPRNAGTAESILSFAPDLVLIDGTTPAATRDLLLRLGHFVVEVDAVSTIDEAIAQIRTVGTLLGHQPEGEALAQLVFSARFQAYNSNWGVTAAYYHRRGYVAAETDLVSDILRIIGLNNAAADYLVRPGGYLSLEALIATPPDYLIVSDINPRVVDQGLALLEHPALLELFPPERRIELPERYTICGGPSLPEAIRLLSTEFRRVSPTPGGQPFG